MGRILFGGTAALLICIFLSPKFIEFLRKREFGQQIREDGPEGHHVKAGTPTMGGRDHLPRGRRLVPDPDRTTNGARWACSARRSRARCSASPTTTSKLVRRRSLGLRARTKLVVTIAISLGLWYVAAHEAHLPPHAEAALRRLPHRPRPAVPAADLPRRRGHHQRGQPHRRPRRPGGGLRGDRAAGLHRHHVPRRRLRHGDARRLPGRRAASAFCGSTRSRRRSSWATPARSGSAARSRGWR